VNRVAFAHHGLFFDLSDDLLNKEQM
jgi:hypothetical protein